MCTIGTVFNQDTNITFKQCDLSSLSHFLDYTVENGKDDILYIGFKRDEGNGCWAGVNNYGVSFVAADSYLAPDSKNKLTQKPVSQTIFEAYEDIISSFKTAAAAKEHMTSFYEGFSSPDILLISDPNEAFFIETNEGEIACIEKKTGHFASTNHFRMLYGGIPYINNHSTYLRLDRAEKNLSNHSNIEGVVNLLEDQYYGNSVFSVCRLSNTAPQTYFPDNNPAVTPSNEDPYFTQASVIFYMKDNKINCAYQLNGNPMVNKYTLVKDMFNNKEVTTHSSDELIQILNKI